MLGWITLHRSTVISHWEWCPLMTFLQMAGYLEYFSIPVFAFLVCIRWIFVIIMCLQESTVIMCAHKASGDPTVQSAAPVRTEDPAPQRTAHVCAHLDTEGPPAKEVSLPHLSLRANSLYLNLKKHNVTTESNHSADLGLIFEELLKGEQAGEKLLVVSRNYLRVNPSSLLSLNHSVCTPTVHTRTHTHVFLTPLACPQQPARSGRFTVLAQGSSEGVLTGSASSGFWKGVCLRLLSSDELTDWEWNSQSQTCKHQFERVSREIKQALRVCVSVCGLLHQMQCLHS